MGALGSLFDGSGGFPLAGALSGITPLWASEIKPYPIAVTTSRFPQMKHLGNVAEVDGRKIPPVDIITFGSPCQDMSVAGKRVGMKHREKGDDATTRSGLFYEAIRVIREMREATNGRYPTFAIWENVPGAFSSNKGQDFAAVLEEIIRIAEPEAPDIEVPEKGWPTWGGYHDEVGGRWSVAWRVHDAQHWGVPQRRRRISVVADFGGDTAGEILFERKSVSRHPAESGTARERLAGDAQDGASYAVRIRACCDGGGKGALVQEDKSGTLGTGNDQTIFCYGISAYESNAMKSSNPKSGVYVADTSRTLDLNGGNPACNQGGMAVVCAGFKLGNSEQARSIGYAEEQSPTLNAECGGNKPAVVALDMSHACDVIRDCGEIVPSLQARMGTGGNQVPLTYQMQGFGDYRAGEVASSCKQRDFKDSTDLVCAVDCRNFREGGETNGTLQAKSNGGTSYNLQNTVRTGMIVRRLTPMECERLQGFPDGWTDIGEWRDSKGKLRKPSDSPRYKALGNSIALPFWDFLAKRISAQYLRPVTMGSLFDGIGGFPLVFERHNGKGTARWASEIEEFPIAVTKLRFGED